MIITKKEFASAARKAVYKVLDEVFEEKDDEDDEIVEAIAWTTAIKFVTNSKEMFGKTGKIDVSEEEFVDKMSDYSADACMDNTAVEKGVGFGITAIMSSVLCTAINARITTNIRKQLFKKEESNGSREDN